MPKLKQPVSLKDAAMDVLVVFCVNYCDKYGDGSEDSLNKIRQGVAVMKEDICPQMPPHLEAEFCYGFIKGFLMRNNISIDTHKCQIRAVAEIMMDRKIIGLRCSDQVIASLNRDDAHRIRGLEQLNLSFGGPDMLQNYHLEDITVLVYQEHCTDSDLELIGQSCQKLLHLDVEYSHITDVGLRTLSPCSDLRTVLITGSSVSKSGITELLSANKRIRRLWARCFDGSSFEWRWLPDSSVYPSIESFTIDLHNSPDEILKSISVKFPNLKSLGIWGKKVGDLVLPNSFGRISELELIWFDGSNWNELQNLFRFVGANLKKLSLRRCYIGNCDLIQIDLDFIFKFCANLEDFEFNFTPKTFPDKLVIPKFEKLKVLRSFNNRGSRVNVEFGQMCELERLMLHGYRITSEEMKSIILDHTRFPKLKMISVTAFKNRIEIWRLRRIIRVNNLDLELEELDEEDGIPLEVPTDNPTGAIA